MVRLEHANLVMQDIQPTLNFLLRAFPEWKVRGEGEMTWGKGEGAINRHWLHVGDDDYYLTLNDQAQGNIRDVKSVQAGIAHLGFVVDDLHGLISRLAEGGFTVDITGQEHPFRKTVYYNDPAGFQFEFMQYHSEKPEEKNMYGGESGQINRKINKKRIKNKADNLKHNVNIKMNRGFIMNNLQAQQLIKNLYQAVDQKDVGYLQTHLSETIRFRIGNNPVATNKAEILEANHQFFNSIHSMTHTIEGVILQIESTPNILINKLACHGRVDYVRLNGTKHSAVFSTVLDIENDLITNYLVFADLSGLFIEE